MLEKVRQTIRERGLIAPGERLLIGVSGGPDSVALLDALAALQPEFGWELHVAHFNHRLRGAESDADEAFVRQLAAGYDLACVTGCDDVAGRAARERLSIEDAARRSRQAFFQETARSLGLGTLALAHTADDQVETLLQRLLRGAGTRGLAAIRPSNRMGRLNVVRPMLDVWKHEVLGYIQQRGLKFRQDASNWDPQFQRNRIRHELIPLLERDYNPKLKLLLHQTAEMLAAEDEWIEDAASRASERCRPRPKVLLADSLSREHVAVQRRAIYRWLLDNNLGEAVDFRTIEALRAMAARATVSELVLTEQWRAVSDGEKIELQSSIEGGQRTATAEVNSHALNVPGVTEIAELGIAVEVEIVPGDRIPNIAARGASRAGFRAPHSLDEWMDADALGGCLRLRLWRPGDRFQPIGMARPKKLQDIFVDEKIPVAQRRRTPLLEAADGTICWVLGYRIGEKFKITPATRQACHVRVRTVET
ncbi:MAG: tRNA lysidine(34) synthetase TilS [Verrucomicrobiae bacterium]|nr:tRNA lysidine(34) synthetase TilS [Verrucomicrobiae bacterium]